MKRPKSLCVAFHAHEFGTDARLFYIPSGAGLPEDTSKIAKKLGFEVDNGEDFSVSFIDNSPAEEIPGIPLIQKRKRKGENRA